MSTIASLAGIIFANMHDSTISDLTKMRAMGSVPFGARYRLIDFPLSNMVNSGISSVGVVTETNYQSLLDHLGAGGEWDLSRKTGGLRMLPPYGTTAGASSAEDVSGQDSRRGRFYRGRLDALANIIGFINNVRADYIVMCDCDVIVNIDFKMVLDFHMKKGADITVVYGKNNCADAGNLKTKTILNIAQNDRVCDVLVNLEDGDCKDVGGEVNASMNMYVMSKEFLLDMVKESKSRSRYNFEVDIIQHRCNEIKIFGYRYHGHYSQIDSLASYQKANIELMDLANRTDVFNPDRPIYTKVRDEAPAKYGMEACVTNSLIADGCIIEGSVEDCVLFRGTKVGKGSVVRNSIIMQDSVIGEKCVLDYVIADKDVIVEDLRSRMASESLPSFVDKGVIV